MQSNLSYFGHSLSDISSLDSKATQVSQSTCKTRCSISLRFSAFLSHCMEDRKASGQRYALSDCWHQGTFTSNYCSYIWHPAKPSSFFSLFLLVLIGTPQVEPVIMVTFYMRKLGLGELANLSMQQVMLKLGCKLKFFNSTIQAVLSAKLCSPSHPVPQVCMWEKAIRWLVCHSHPDLVLSLEGSENCLVSAKRKSITIGGGGRFKSSQTLLVNIGNQGAL